MDLKSKAPTPQNEALIYAQAHTLLVICFYQA